MDNTVIDANTTANMRKLATHIVHSAPMEIVRTFSVDFLIQSFKNDLNTFETTWTEYQRQLHENIKEGDTLQNPKLIKFSQKG